MNMMKDDRFGGLFFAPKLPHTRPKQAPFLHSRGRAFFATISAKGGLKVHEYIARLIDAGMPRKVAAGVCVYYQRRGKRQELAHYVEAVEKENGKASNLE